VARVPAHRQHDDLTGEPEPSDAGPRRRHSTVATTHQHSLPQPVIHQRNSAPTTPRVMTAFAELTLAI
ncbi:MAG: hypothetical protein ACRDRW_04690, partial [Pseudonocardiaceae bacterium]